MRYHCHLCGGWLKFWEEPIKKGRILHCDCNKCGHRIEQRSPFLCEHGFTKARVVGNIMIQNFRRG